MSEMFPVTLQDQIACVRRELAMRANAYPRFIASGKMKQAKADREIAVMEGVLNMLCSLRSFQIHGFNVEQQHAESAEDYVKRRDIVANAFDLVRR